jgi:hypothetical protein
MPDAERLQNMLDKFEIQEVVAAACYSRDHGDWDTLRDSYHPDGTITVSWHSGPVDEFIERSKKMKVNQGPQEFTKHVNANQRVRLNGDRAIIEYDVILHNRRIMEGFAIDFHTWSRYFDQVERRDDRWRIFNRSAIYEKDRMDPHNPREIPDSFYEDMNLEQYPLNIRYHCWRNAKTGQTPPEGIVIARSEREKQIRETAEKWLAGE